MKRLLPFSRDLELPTAAVTQKFAILGTSGHGKTYSAMRLAELMLEVNAQVIALDPVGPWWGLRASASGKRAGFPITVFGGDHGDLPLTPESGALIADVLVDRSISAVLDISQFTTAETKRFVRDFAEQFFQRKKRPGGSSPVHIFFEEAQTFAPQMPERDEGVMLNRVERLLKIGRNYGIGWTLISQQPQAVHKRCLNQAGTVIAVATIGKHEKKAIFEWVNDKVTKDEDLNLLDNLPSLEIGKALVWSPAWLRIARLVYISKKITFDSSATPEFGAKVKAPKKLAPVDIKALKEAMKGLVEKVQTGDPAWLQKRISELEAELSQAKKQKVQEVVKEVSVLKEQHVKRLEKAIERMKSVAAGIDKAAGDIQYAIGFALGKEPLRLERLVKSSPQILSDWNTPGTAAHRAMMIGEIPKPPPEYRTTTSDALKKSVHALADQSEKRQNGAVAIKKGARTMLIALSRRQGMWVSRSALGVLAGLSSKSGTFSSYLSALRSTGLVLEHNVNADLQISKAGLEFLGPLAQTKPASTQELIAVWSQAIKKDGARRMLHRLVEWYPVWAQRDYLGSATNISSTSGTFSAYLSILRSAGLIEEKGQEVRANQALFIS